MKNVWLCLLFVSLQATAATNDLVGRVNEALEVILESVVSEQKDVVVLKDANGEYVVDKDGNRVTELKVDPEYTDLDANKVKVGARVTINDSRWTPGEQTGVGLWAYAHLDRDNLRATIGGSANLHTDTIAFLRFVLTQTVAQVWDEGLPVDADLFETMAYNSLSAASVKLSTVEEFAGILVFLKGGLLNLAKQEMNQDEKLGLPRRSHTLDSLEALTVDYDTEKEELVVAYVQEQDPNDTLDNLVKNIDLTTAEVRFTEELVQLNVEVALENLKETDVADLEGQKDQGLVLLEMFLPALQDKEQVEELTSGVREFVNEVVEFLTKEDADLNIL